jgi:hypothetical protein
MEHGRRSHEHAHSGHTSHDAHIRHHSDNHKHTHLKNAVSHLEGMHAEAGSLRTNHWSHEGEPHPSERKDSPGV